MRFEKFQIYTGELATGDIIRKGIATDSEELKDSGPGFFFPAVVGTIIKGPVINIEDFPGLVDVVTFE